MRILAAIRAILARFSVDELYNTMAHDVITNHIIPDLKKRDADPELIAMYEKYADPINRLSKKFGEFMGNATANTLRSRGMGEDDIQDAAQEIITKFYKKSKWNRFRPDTGPEGFLKFLAYIAKQESLAFVMSKSRRWEREVQLVPIDEDDTEFEERLQSRAIKNPASFLDEVMTKDTIQDLRKYMSRHLKKEWQREIFDQWMDMLSRGSRVNLNQDLVNPISEEYGIPFSTVRSKIQDLKKLMVRFFKTQYDFSSLRASERVASLGLTERVAYSAYRRVIADWVLPSNPLCRRVLFI